MAKQNKKPPQKADDKTFVKAPNIHDAFFKNTFSYPEIAKSMYF